MAFVDPDYDSSDQFNPLNTGRNLIQDDIDFICKVYQRWHDFFFGADNDDASLSQLQPFTCSFVGCMDTDVRAFGGQLVSLNGAAQSKAHCLYSFVFDGYNAYYSGFQPVYAQSILNQTSEQGLNNLAIYLAGCEAAANGSSLVSTRKDNIDFTNDRCIDGSLNPSTYQKDYIYPCSYKIFLDSNFNENDYGFHLMAMRKYYNLFNTVYTYGDSNNLKTSTSDVVVLDFYNPPAYIDENATPQSGYYKNFGTGAWSNAFKGTPLKPFKGQGAFVSIGANTSETFINNFTQDVYVNSFTYTNDDGDTINVNYGDNFINIGGGDPGGGVSLNYYDLENILQRLIDDLTINGNLVDIDGQPLVLDVPSFEEIKYGDRGDLYFTKWQMYPENTAPHVVAKDTLFGDLTPDGGVMPEWVSTVGTTVSIGVNGFLSLFPDWIGILIGVCFVAAFLIRNLRKG